MELRRPAYHGRRLDVPAMLRPCESLPALTASAPRPSGHAPAQREARAAPFRRVPAGEGGAAAMGVPNGRLSACGSCRVAGEAERLSLRLSLGPVSALPSALAAYVPLRGKAS